MSAHQSDQSEGAIESHPVKATLVVVIGLFAMVVGLMLLAQLAIGLYGGRSLTGNPAMSSERVGERIAPVAKVNVGPASPAPAPQAEAIAPQGSAPAPLAEAAKVASAAPSAPAASAPGAAPAAANAGKQVFDSTCTACHSVGLVGAPKFGDKAAWAPRIAQGTPALYHSALNGKNAMPPRGGNANLSDAEVKSAVDYMVAAAK